MAHEMKPGVAKVNRRTLVSFIGLCFAIFVGFDRIATYVFDDVPETWSSSLVDGLIATLVFSGLWTWWTRRQPSRS
ncbi:MAG: hypothetical protein H6514_16050 [Acidimicrobiaceae bacterium]|nr:hypothetical protein [Acidimicrobiaceae bacterium]